MGLELKIIYVLKLSYDNDFGKVFQHHDAEIFLYLNNRFSLMLNGHAVPSTDEPVEC